MFSWEKDNRQINFSVVLASLFTQVVFTCLHNHARIQFKFTSIKHFKYLQQKML